MRKLMVILMAMLMVFSLACAGASAEGTLLAGGWQASADPAVTEALRAVFEKGMEGLLGVSYTPVVYLGSQVVAGTNHAFLCQATVVYPGAVPEYKIVYLYEDLQGGVSILDIADFDFGAFCDYGAGAAAEEDPYEGRYLSFTSAEGSVYDLFSVTKMNYGADHQVTSVTGHFERVVQEEDCDAPETAPDSEKTYPLAADFRADMISNMFDGGMDFVPVTDLYAWYLSAYMEPDIYDGHELVFACDMTEEQQEKGGQDFWFVTTKIVLNDQDEIEYMRYVYVPWA